MTTIIHPPITGDSQLDSWTYQLTSLINQGLNSAEISAAQSSVDSGSTTLFLYQRSTSNSTAPTLPTSVAYNFENSPIVSSADNGWTSTIPTTGDDNIWVTLRYVAARSGTITGSNSWNTAALLGTSGAAGSDGVSTYQAIVFQRATSAPSAPTDGSFNFGNNTLTNPTGWSDTVPSGNNPIYATRNLFSISGDTGTDTSVNWSTPTLFVENGTDGLSTFLFPIYIRASSAPSTPTGGDYNFGTNSGTAPSGWSTSVPSGTNPIYVSTSLASVQGATGSDTSLTWSSPQILAQNGTDGADAPQIGQRIIYTNPAVASAPSAPAATITWSTGALSGMSSGWSESPPTQSATSSNSVYSSVVVFNDTSGSATTTTATGATPVKATEFSGLVTFSSGDFSLDGSTITNIDGGNITTGTVNAGALTSGNLSVGSDAIPTSGSGAKLTSTGDVTFGSTDRYVAWDESAADLRIQGDIINVSETSAGVASSSWVQIDTSQSLTNVMSALGGAGPFAFIMVGGGGGAAACGFQNNGSNENQPRYNTTAHAGGASGYANWIYEWDGTTAVSVALGTGGNGGHRNQNNSNQRMALADGATGNASTFSVGGTTVVTTNPGRGGGNSFSANASPNTANSGTNGPGGGGTVSITTSSTLTSLAEYTGGAGGNGFTETHEDFNGNIDSSNNSALWCSPGGGGVRAFANVSNTAGGNKVGGSGGGPFGPGIGGSSLGQGNNPSSAGAGLPTTFSSNASVTNSGNANAGSNNITGVFVTDGPGSTAAGNNVGNTNTASNGMLGGGGRAGNTSNGNFKGSQGGVFGGGGGIAIGGISENTDAGHLADGGNGGFGGGGGTSYARQSRGGDGGDGVLYIKKL